MPSISTMHRRHAPYGSSAGCAQRVGISISDFCAASSTVSPALAFMALSSIVRFILFIIAFTPTRFGLSPKYEKPKMPYFKISLGVGVLPPDIALRLKMYLQIITVILPRPRSIVAGTFSYCIEGAYAETHTAANAFVFMYNKGLRRFFGSCDRFNRTFFLTGAA
jgi:hypothetical protein